MHRPVLVTPPEILPVSLAEAKLHLRVDHADDDELITSLIAAAVDHLDGWTGILGRCLVEQTWRQDFDAGARCFALPLGPAIEIVSVIAGGATVDPAGYYSLKVDAGGRASVAFTAGVVGAVSVTYRSGYPTTPQDNGPPVVPAKSTVPAAIKAAIMLLVGHYYEHREASVVGASVETLPMAVDALLSPYRRVGL